MSELEIEDFDTAKAVFEKLKDLPEDRRKTILTWIAEGLGISLAKPDSPSPPAPPPPPGTYPPPPPPGGATDIKTFIAGKAPKSDNQFAAAVAYYYRFEAPPESRKETINGDDLQEAARLAGRARLQAPRGTLNNAKAAGYLDSGTPGEFSINSVGENLVAMTLPGTAESASNNTRRRKKAKKKSKKTAKKKTKKTGKKTGRQR